MHYSFRQIFLSGHFIISLQSGLSPALMHSPIMSLHQLIRQSKTQGEPRVAQRVGYWVSLKGTNILTLVLLQTDSHLYYPAISHGESRQLKKTTSSSRLGSVNVEFKIASRINIGNLTDCNSLTASGAETVEMMERNMSKMGVLIFYS